MVVLADDDMRSSRRMPSRSTTCAAGVRAVHVDWDLTGRRAATRLR
ncbi:MAG: hypothetical protein ACLSVD_03760 [Eggerthellaceae bacterium]